MATNLALDQNPGYDDNAEWERQRCICWSAPDPG